MTDAWIKDDSTENTQPCTNPICIRGIVSRYNLRLGSWCIEHCWICSGGGRIKR